MYHPKLGSKINTLSEKESWRRSTLLSQEYNNHILKIKWKQRILSAFQDPHTVLQCFITVRSIYCTASASWHDRNRQNSHPFNLPLPKSENRGNVISSWMLLLQLIACLHLVENNCWPNLRKPRGAPPRPSARHITSFKNCWEGGTTADEQTLSSSPISGY